MTTSELMRAMADAGAPFEAILIAVQAIEERDAAIAQKRAVERDRKRRQRAKSQDMDVTVTGQSQDEAVTVTGTASLSLPPLSSPQTPQQTPPTHTHPEKTTRARKGTGPLAAKPDSVSDATWRDFQALRQRKHAPLTETAMAGIVREAKAAGWSLESALAQSVTRGWQGFEAEWVKGKPDPAAANRHDAHRAAFERRHPVVERTEAEARALMEPAEFEQWRARQRRNGEAQAA